MVTEEMFKDAMWSATNEIMKEKGLKRVSEINNFDCYNWAFKVFDRIPGSFIGGHRFDEEGQSFIVWNGRYYDAETPEGVEKWWMLRSFQRMFNEGIRLG